ncbi:hypothetical protein [Thermospira aquatica]|uniref:Uncharacterized protein n=1 Tax=Thermospira aquatica TaxID=2828656 RepID=A0AAX3BD07_9SPIR|nr:hypothetical protein [Thermospira aquatica]URA10030.1 hypothetical protein KDW03_11190 [Thermospira aquatica]
MRTCLVLPLHTELGEIREKLVLFSSFQGRVIAVGDPVPSCDRLVIDLTMDWFRPMMTPAMVMELFASLYEYFSFPDVEKVVLQGYTLETNDGALQRIGFIFEGMVRMMRDLFGVKTVRLPTIISRRGLLNSKHPLMVCLSALKHGVQERIRWSAQSEVVLAYEMDMLPWLLDWLTSDALGCGNLGGERYTLGEIVEKTEMIFSYAGVTFDSHRWFRALPGEECLNVTFSYGIENIAMDLLDV